MKLLILGAGGIGGLFGARLVQAGADVTFLVRENRKAQLDRDGLQVESQFGNFKQAVNTITTANLGADYDIVVLTCKAYDLPSAIDSIRPAMQGRAAVLPFLNGLAHIELLNQEFGKDKVMGGTARVQVTMTSEGIIRQLNDWQTLTFGEQDGSASARAAQFKALLEKTAVEAKLSADIMRELWLKAVHLATVAGMTVMMRSNLGEIVRTPEGTALLTKFFQRNAEIATHAGYAPDEKFINTYLELFRTRDSKYEASMLRDLEKGGPIESEQILGHMLRQCRQAQLPDDLHLVAYTHVKSYEERRAAGRLPKTS